MITDAFKAHLETGFTHTCRCWLVTRKDGFVLGFTDHDLPLAFEGIDFLPESGLTARAIEQTTGLSVDNTEAMGILSADAITEADILAGRYDGAEVKSWIVNWGDVEQRLLQFVGTIGEIQRDGHSFQAELRGLTEALNQPQGRIFQKPCSAILGDHNCGFNLDDLGYSTTAVISEARSGKFFEFENVAGFEARWFERGRFVAQTGAAAGLVGVIKNDRSDGTMRKIETWEQIRADIAPGDTVRLEAGCDRRTTTCRLKFNNLVNYRGFPTIPGEDWLMSVPRKDGANDGGSLAG